MSVVIDGNSVITSPLSVGFGGGNVTTNTAAGYQALNANTTGLENTAIGYNTLATNAVGTDNVADSGNVAGNVTVTTGTTNNVTPELFTYVGPRGPRQPSLAKLVTMQQYPTTGITQGTAPRAPGEIESEVTGKKRRNVWNEASLRLKDALGL